MNVSSTLAELFGKSPITPLQEHMRLSVSAADQLSAFYDACNREDWQQAESIYEKIREIEETADSLKKRIRLQLPKRFFMPVARTDLLELLSKQDKIANTAKDIAGLMLGRKMLFPETLRDPCKIFLEAAIRSTRQAHKAISELDELLESSFSGPVLSMVEKLIEEIDATERQADLHEVALRRALFERESSLPPVDVMFMYKAIETIGELADRAEKVGSGLIRLLAR